jgi:hypothetical protein
MHRFQISRTTVDSKKEMHYSSRYDDRELIKGEDEKAKLDWLTRKIQSEIAFCGGDIVKLERLQERYHSDGRQAKADDNMPYYLRYAQSYELLKLRIEALYLKYKPVTDDGRFNQEFIAPL